MQRVCATNLFDFGDRVVARRPFIVDRIAVKNGELIDVRALFGMEPAELRSREIAVHQGPTGAVIVGLY